MDEFCKSSGDSSMEGTAAGEGTSGTSGGTLATRTDSELSLSPDGMPLGWRTNTKQDATRLKEEEETVKEPEETRDCTGVLPDVARNC